MGKLKTDRLNFLFEAIHDTQQWIRFLDTKAGALALFITTILLLLTDSVIRKVSLFLNCLLTVKFGFLAIVLISILYVGLPIYILLLVFLILSPNINPMKHIKKKDKDILGIFFLSTLDKEGNLAISLDNYYSTLQKANKEAIFNELIHEFMKLSYIRILKEKRMKIVTWLVFMNIVLSLAGYIIVSLYF